jgi:hypothetical protein
VADTGVPIASLASEYKGDIVGLFMQGMAATTAERHAAGQLHSTMMRERAARTPDKMVSRRLTTTILDASSRSEGVTTIRVDDSYTGDPTITKLFACEEKVRENVGNIKSEAERKV